jgi:hypothetical protein
VGNVLHQALSANQCVVMCIDFIQHHLVAASYNQPKSRHSDCSRFGNFASVQGSDSGAGRHFFFLANDPNYLISSFNLSCGLYQNCQCQFHRQLVFFRKTTLKTLLLKTKFHRISLPIQFCERSRIFVPKLKCQKLSSNLLTIYSEYPKTGHWNSRNHLISGQNAIWFSKYLLPYHSISGQDLEWSGSLDHYMYTYVYVYCILIHTHINTPNDDVFTYFGESMQNPLSWCRVHV